MKGSTWSHVKAGRKGSIRSCPFIPSRGETWQPVDAWYCLCAREGEPRSVPALWLGSRSHHQSAETKGDTDCFLISSIVSDFRANELTKANDGRHLPTEHWRAFRPDTLECPLHLCLSQRIDAQASKCRGASQSAPPAKTISPSLNTSGRGRRKQPGRTGSPAGVVVEAR